MPNEAPEQILPLSWEYYNILGIRRWLHIMESQNRRKP